MTGSFALNLKAIKVRLENNQALNDFCIEKLNKALSPVRRRYKAPDEIELADCPMIFITHPGVRRTWANLISNKEHTVSVYGVFHWVDESDAGQEEAAGLMVEFEELIEAAVHTRAAGDMPMDIKPGNGVNDEGMYHPVYGTKLDFIVKTK